MATEIIEIIIANTMVLMNMGIGIMDAATTGTAAGIRLAVAVGQARFGFAEAIGIIS
ncbi:MAG TPA: hypothetical protein PKE16_12225 [Hyphomicrobium sp.]|nr:hypothetical protein [Hyphomicrobium sp.]